MDNTSLKDRIIHIKNAISLIEKFVDQVSETEFLADLKLQSAIQFQFLIIREAVKYIDISILEKYPYPWHIPRSFRNFIIHEYHGVKMERIYYASKDLENLKLQIHQILQNEF
ncbi:MAG: HepT-like ribonuclease domain-containing protein [Pelobium sp.]